MILTKISQFYSECDVAIVPYILLHMALSVEMLFNLFLLHILYKFVYFCNKENF